MRRWIANTLVLLTLAAANLGAAETNSISLSGAVYREQGADAGLTDVFLAELSKQKGVNILGRSVIKLMLGELSLYCILIGNGIA